MPEPDATLNLALIQLATLESAFIDASSLIYMKKCGFLTLLGESIRLLSIPEVVRETSYATLPLKLIPNERTPHMTDTQPDSALQIPQTPDDLLVLAAADKALPVISEDKRVLNQARAQGLPCFNAVMMLHFLYFKNLLSRREHTRYLEKLRQIARYSPQVWAFSQKVYDRIEKLLSHLQD